MTSIAPPGGDEKEGARDLIFKLLGKAPAPGPGQGEGKSMEPAKPPPPPGLPPSAGREEGKVLLDFLKNNKTQANRDREKEDLLKSVLFGGGGGKEESASASTTTVATG